MNKYNILIPMGGKGSRFKKHNYTFPKPLIEVHGKPMIQKVIENLNIPGHYIYLVSKEDYNQYALNYLLPLITPNCDIVVIQEFQPGAAAACLLAQEYIDNDQSLIIANSDQIFEMHNPLWYQNIAQNNTDGIIITFDSIHPKNSFARIDNNGFVVEVAEKTPISHLATSGIYCWTKGSDFLKYTQQMIKKNIRINGEFYVCPVYNEAILDGKKIITMPSKKHWPIGTPEDLNYYLEHNDK